MVKEKTIVFVCLCCHLVGESQTFVYALVVNKDQSSKIILDVILAFIPRYYCEM